MTAAEEQARWDAIDRPLGWLIALGGSVLILDQTIVQAGRLADFAPWWNAGSLLVVAAIVALAVGGMLLPAKVVGFLWQAVPLTYLAFQATWLIGYVGADLDAARPWLWTVEPAVITLLLLIVRPVVAVAVGLGFSLVPALTSLFALGHLPEAIRTQTPNELGNVVYVAIFIGVRIQLERLHAGEREAQRQRENQVRADARLEQQAVLARFVHDEVLSALSAGMHADGSPSEPLRRDARNAIEAISVSADPEPDNDSPLTSTDALALLTASLRRIDPAVTLEPDCRPGEHPARVVRTIALAAGEALRNSLRHAGADATRRVEITLSANLIRIAVRDDGVGFTPDPHSQRLGVQRSIVDRMADLGGSARIDSAPGRGTQVVLAWPT